MPTTCADPLHSAQVAALCGVHTINTLLQGPYINEIVLAQVRRATRGVDV